MLVCRRALICFEAAAQSSVTFNHQIRYHNGI